MEYGGTTRCNKMFWKKKIGSDEYLELMRRIEALKIDFNSLRLDFDLIVTKLKVKYKITTREKKQTDDEEFESWKKDIKRRVLLCEDGTMGED